jgi:formylglycine-generating enzyme
MGALLAAAPYRSHAATAPAPEAGAATHAGMVRIPGGSYQPLYKRAIRDSATGVETRIAQRVLVAPFWMDVHPVTNAAFLEFVGAHPEWRRSQAKRLFAEAGYLRHWRSDLDPGPEAPPTSPVVDVSWFAARAYCAAYGKRLPTVNEWEYAAASERQREGRRDPAFTADLRRWYAKPTPGRLPAVGTTFRNAYGVWDLHGLVWEWTLDFNSALVTGESRGDASLEKGLYCGSGAANAADFDDYAAFMRYGFRSSLEARYTVANLGFRGVCDAAAKARGGR